MLHLSSPAAAAQAAADGHARIDRIVDDVRRMLDDSELDRAEYSFRDVAEELRRHLKTEEALLFPFYQRLGDRGAALTEHERLDALLRFVEESFAQGRLATARAAVDQLAAALYAHERRESELLATVPELPAN